MTHSGPRALKRFLRPFDNGIFVSFVGNVVSRFGEDLIGFGGIIFELGTKLFEDIRNFNIHVAVTNTRHKLVQSRNRSLVFAHLQKISTLLSGI